MYVHLRGVVLGGGLDDGHGVGLERGEDGHVLLLGSYLGSVWCGLEGGVGAGREAQPQSYTTIQRSNTHLQIDELLVRHGAVGEPARLLVPAELDRLVAVGP